MADSENPVHGPSEPARMTAGADGTQAIRRAAHLLRVIAMAGPAGASLTEISRSEGLSRSTAHRILKCLVDEGLLAPTATGRRYQMGPLVHELSLIPMSSSIEVARWRPAVDAVARRTGATAYLMRRSGIEAVCLVKADGHSVLRFVPVEVGQRRLLGVGAGATALLAALDTAQREDVIDRIAPGLRPYPRITTDSLREAVRGVHQTGFAVSVGAVVEDGFGIGAIVADPAGKPHLAISIAAHRSTVTEANVTAWKRILAEEIQAGLRDIP